MKELLHKKHRLIFIVVMLVAAFSIMALIMYSFSKEIVHNQTQLGKERLREIAEQNVNFVKQRVEDKISLVEAIAFEMAEVEDLNSEKAVNLLKKRWSGTGFARMAIDFLNGESHTTDGFTVDISDLNYIDDIKKGKSFITDLIVTKVDGKPSVSFITPITKNEAIVGAIRATIHTQSFGDMLSINFFDGEGYFSIINSKGEALAMSGNNNVLLQDNNYFDGLDHLTFDKGYSKEAIKKDIISGKGGTTSYSLAGNGRYVEYEPIGIDDWHLVIMVPKWVIDKNASLIQNEISLLMIEVSLISLAVILYVFFTMRGSIAEIKKINAKLSLGEERYRFMLERSDNIIFEYTLEDGGIEYSGKFMEIFGYSPTTTKLPESIIISKGVHTDDAPSLRKLFNDIVGGKPNTNAELRIRDSSGGYVWCSIVAATIFNDEGVPIKALGVIENIDNQKQREISLITKAEHDELTGLYNKITTEKYIKEFLQRKEAGTETSALLIVDIDDFKTVNDKHGHLFGDIVLAGLAEKLKSIFRKDDIIGRIGGDEFFVFMKNVPTKQIVEDKAKEICVKFFNVYSENDLTCQISASVGIAMTVDNSIAFEQLYKNADVALYSTKAEGKNNFSFYNGQAFGGYESNRTEIDALGLLHQKNFKNNTTEYIFKILYGSENVISAVHSVLELLSDHFGFSRGYIFETSEDGKTTTNTFEWCAKDIEPQIDKLQKLPIEVISIAEASFKETGIYALSINEANEIERLVLEPQKIKSVFQFGMFDNGKLLGLIGFDNCENEFVPTDVEVDEMVTMSSLLGTFLVKHRAIEKAKKNYESISMLMNSFDNYAYIVEKSSYKILFLNDKLKEKLVDFENLEECYRTIQQLDKPCENCIMKMLDSTNEIHCIPEFYIKCFGKTMKSTITSITWSNGEDACLVVLV